MRLCSKSKEKAKSVEQRWCGLGSNLFRKGEEERVRDFLSFLSALLYICAAYMRTQDCACTTLCLLIVGHPGIKQHGGSDSRRAPLVQQSFTYIVVSRSAS